MGTDIHMYAEKRREGVWRSCYPLETKKVYGEPVAYIEPVYENDRNYVLFRILADVDRLTNQGFASISPPRGLPDDMSPGLQKVAKSYEDTGSSFCHNYSWLLLRELLAFPLA